MKVCSKEYSRQNCLEEVFWGNFRQEWNCLGGGGSYSGGNSQKEIFLGGFSMEIKGGFSGII